MSRGFSPGKYGFAIESALFNIYPGFCTCASPDYTKSLRKNDYTKPSCSDVCSIRVAHREVEGGLEILEPLTLEP